MDILNQILQAAITKEGVFAAAFILWTFMTVQIMSKMHRAHVQTLQSEIDRLSAEKKDLQAHFLPDLKTTHQDALASAQAKPLSPVRRVLDAVRKPQQEEQVQRVGHRNNDASS